MEADPDRALVERCRHDDANALRELLERYQDAVFGPIARVTPIPARAEQLAQDVFLRIHRNIPYFRGEAPVRTWILRTAAEVCPAAFDTGSVGDARLARAAGSAPPHFAVRTIARIRREHWRREQLLDLAFNVAIAGVAIATVALVWYFVDASGLSELAQSSAGLVKGQLADVARTIAPSIPGYVAAVAVIGSVLLVWWWAER